MEGSQEQDDDSFTNVSLADDPGKETERDCYKNIRSKV